MCCCNSSLSAFSLPLPKREPTFVTSAAFASVLPASSFFDLIPCFTSSSRCSVCCCSVCNYCALASSSPVCRIKSYAVLLSHVRHVTNRIFPFPLLLRYCRGRQLVSHVAARHRHTDARYWLSCGRIV